jgi:nucleoid DNA-binding protein
MNLCLNLALMVMKSETTKKIIKEIAKEEGLSEWAVELIVKSQFDGVYETIRSGIPDNIDSFKGVRLNAFGHFKVNKNVFKRFKSREDYENKKRLRYDNKK